MATFSVIPDVVVIADILTAGRELHVIAGSYPLPPFYSLPVPIRSRGLTVASAFP